MVLGNTTVTGWVILSLLTVIVIRAVSGDDGGSVNLSAVRKNLENRKMETATSTVEKKTPVATEHLPLFEKDILSKMNFDRNADGIADIRIFKSANGRLTRVAEDTRKDGRMDTWYYFDRFEKLSFYDRDANHDGVIDVRVIYENNKIMGIAYDRENRGMFNEFIDYVQDHREVWVYEDTNYDGRVDRWTFFQTRVKKRQFEFSTTHRRKIELGLYLQAAYVRRKAFIDADFSGVPEEAVFYDKDGKQERREIVQNVPVLKEWLFPLKSFSDFRRTLRGL